MKPIAILRFASAEGPGYFAMFLNQHAMPWKLIRIDEGEPVPAQAEAYLGLVLMGGPMSANDPLPWIPDVMSLIRDAFAANVPLLGHCLGAQLIAKALGGAVSSIPQKEMGWGRVQVADNALARRWFGDIQSFDAFHWHGESFSLPVGASPILSSPYCLNQGFVMGQHLALQCHLEMTAPMIVAWAEIGLLELAENTGTTSVQSAAEMQVQSAEKLSKLHYVAAQLYRHWLQGLKTQSFP